MCEKRNGVGGDMQMMYICTNRFSVLYFTFTATLQPSGIVLSAEGVVLVFVGSIPDVDYPQFFSRVSPQSRLASGGMVP